MDNRIPEQREEDAAQETRDLENLEIAGRHFESLKGKRLSESLKGVEELQNMLERTRTLGLHSLFHLFLL